LGAKLRARSLGKLRSVQTAATGTIPSNSRTPPNPYGQHSMCQIQIAGPPDSTTPNLGFQLRASTRGRRTRECEPEPCTRHAVILTLSLCCACITNVKGYYPVAFRSNGNPRRLVPWFSSSLGLFHLDSCPKPTHLLLSKIASSTTLGANNLSTYSCTILVHVL
jgi:hypothetical protein